MRPRVPITTRPQGTARVAPQLGRPCRRESAAAVAANSESRSLLFELQDQGPPDGLTIEQAIERLVASIPLRAKSLDIPQAQADALTAGLHANPVVYIDGQLLPYKAYNSTTNPGGPAQYDLNVAYPLDLSGKRRARRSGQRREPRGRSALSGLGAAGGQWAPPMSTRWRRGWRCARSTRAGADRRGSRASPPSQDPKQDVVLRRQIQFQRQTAIGAGGSGNDLSRLKRSLAMMLDLPLATTSGAGTARHVEDTGGLAPPIERARLARTGKSARPGGLSARFAACRRRCSAVASESAARRLLALPAADLSRPDTVRSAVRVVGAGATVVLPIFDRNQGNIRRRR